MRTPAGLPDYPGEGPLPDPTPAFATPRAFRALGDSLTLTLNDPATVADMAASLETYLSEHQTLRGLLPVTKFSTESKVLSSSAILRPGVTYAVLPPVSGG